MKVIIDPYRGGKDTGKNISGQYEKNILLNISKQMTNFFKNKGIDTELVRTNDVSLTDDERNSIINELKNNNDIILQNRISENNEFNIIYPLRSNDNLPSIISKELESKGINLDKYFQRRLPTETMLDYYNVIRNTTPNETLIIEYPEEGNYEEIVNIIVNSISDYINRKNTYIVKSGDSLYQIAKKYNTSVDEIKKINNLTTNSLSIGQILKLPNQNSNTSEENIEKDYQTYIVKSGDSLYQIAKKYNTSVDEIKRLNNLTTNLLSIGQILKIPNENLSSEEDDNKKDYQTYTVKSGDSLYQIAKKYNTNVDEIKRLNNLTTNLLSIGQILKIPNENSNSEEDNIEKGYQTYTVKSGDSLYQIAKKYNTSVDKIKRLNNLTTNLLSIGQVLKIPNE